MQHRVFFGFIYYLLIFIQVPKLHFSAAPGFLVYTELLMMSCLLAQVLQVNGNDFTMVTHEKAVKYIKKYPVLHMLVARKGVSNWSLCFVCMCKNYTRFLCSSLLIFVKFSCFYTLFAIILVRSLTFLLFSAMRSTRVNCEGFQSCGQ